MLSRPSLRLERQHGPQLSLGRRRRVGLAAPPHLASVKGGDYRRPFAFRGTTMSVTAVPLRPIKKGSVAKLWAALVVLALLTVALAWWTTGHHRFTRTASGLGFQVVKEGEGPTPGAKDIVVINYIGR